MDEKIDLVEEYRAAKSQLEEIYSSYRIMISSRNDFVLGIFIGLISSALISYVTELEKIMNPSGGYSINTLLPRIGVLFVALGFILYIYWRKTMRFREVSKRINQRITELNVKIKKFEEQRGPRSTST